MRSVASFVRATAVASFAFLAEDTAAAPPLWTVDRAASKIRVVSSFDGSSQALEFQRWSAEIAFDPEDLAHSKAEVKIDVGSFLTADKATTDALPSEEWFSAAKFPTATFTSTRFRALSRDRFEVSGDLNLKGVTRPVRFAFEFRPTDTTAVVRGVFPLRRKAFGIGGRAFKSPEIVPFEVLVFLDIRATRP